MTDEGAVSGAASKGPGKQIFVEPPTLPGSLPPLPEAAEQAGGGGFWASMPDIPKLPKHKKPSKKWSNYNGPLSVTINDLDEDCKKGKLGESLELCMDCYGIDASHPLVCPVISIAYVVVMKVKRHLGAKNEKS